MKITLPTVYPKIDCYPDLANMFSILGCYDVAEKWITANFYQLVFRRDDNTSFGNFLDIMRMGNDVYAYQYCPNLYINLIDKEFVENNYNNIFEFVSYCLSKGFYLQIYVNKMYIRQKGSPDFDFMHEIFIYGIDFEKKEILLADFFDGVYKQFGCNFKEFEQAYLNSFKNNAYFQSEIYFKYPHMTKYNMNKIVLIQFCNAKDFACDKNIIIKKISDYRHAKNSFGRLTESYIADGYKFFYGLDYYRHLIDDLQKDNLDIRKPYVLTSHKKILQMQIDSWITHNFIDAVSYKKLSLEIIKLINLSTILYRKYMKIYYSSKEWKSRIDSLCNEYEMLKIQDDEFMEKCEFALKEFR